MKVVRFLGAVQNMGWADRVLRFVIGLALIVYALVMMETRDEIGGYAYVFYFSIYPMLTAILGWDPLYRLFQARSCNDSGRNACGTFPFEVEASLGKKVECGDGYDCSLSGSRHAHQGHH